MNMEFIDMQRLLPRKKKRPEHWIWKVLACVAVAVVVYMIMNCLGR